MTQLHEPTQRTVWESTDVRLLFVTRMLRMASYGALTNILLRYFTLLGFSAIQVGILLTGILLGDLLMTLYLTTRADTIGRIKVLTIGAALKAYAGIVFAHSTSFHWLLLAGIIGVISPAGGEVGPFLATEQAALTDVMIRVYANGKVGEALHQYAKSNEVTSRVAEMFGWYNAFGYAALAMGNMMGGEIIQYLQKSHGELVAFRWIFYLYAGMAGFMMILYRMVSPQAEAEAISSVLPRNTAEQQSKPDEHTSKWYYFGLKQKKSRLIVLRLSALFAMDSFAGGFAMQTAIVVWLAGRWNIQYAALGWILSAANIASGASTIAAGYMVKWCGAVPTMVYTHLPSNLILMLVPIMPTAHAAVGMLILRFSISQMDVPARQAYVSTVVDSSERSAAGGVTNVVRSLGLALSPFPLAYLQSRPPMSMAFSAIFFISGTLKCLYDIILYVSYRMAQATVTTSVKSQLSEKTPLLDSRKS